MRKGQVWKYFIEFSLTWIEGTDRFGRAVWAKGRWPILFDSAEEARDFMKKRENALFLNLHRAAIKSATVTGVRIK